MERGSERERERGKRKRGERERERERERDSTSYPFLINKHPTVHTRCLLTWQLGKKWINIFFGVLE